ncbi:DMT family transporter [Colwellia piezophila]|uniref:DMT family transporter n=1 Tax=Colwellia piezophila TaxID=211668 RepID=UPI0003646783|nr:DMT family transporter [Colwellia piezophila]
MSNKYLIKTSLLTALALIAFAANSVLCRLALGNGAIDASSFTGIRLLSGAIALFIILSLKASIKGSNKAVSSKGSWTAGFSLFLYAITFSYAYLSVDTGTGALILFGTVQITIILLSVMSGTRLHISEWSGVIIAFIGFVYLILPNITAPSIDGFMLMTVAGISWGIYTLKGRSSENPLMDTTYNFLRTIPFVALLTVFTLQSMHYSLEGIVLALLSGVITSGLGYTIWYIALGGLSSTQAAVMQLSVPIIAAIGGVMFVSEVITVRLIISATIVLGGILIVVLGKYFSQQKIANKT